MGVIAEGIPRGCQGLFTPVSLGYPHSIFNKNSTLTQSSPTSFPVIQWQCTCVTNAAIYCLTSILPLDNRIMSVYVLLRTVVPHLLRAKVDRHN